MSFDQSPLSIYPSKLPAKLSWIIYQLTSPKQTLKTLTRQTSPLLNYSTLPEHHPSSPPHRNVCRSLRLLLVCPPPLPFYNEPLRLTPPVPPVPPPSKTRSGTSHPSQPTPSAPPTPSHTTSNHHRPTRSRRPPSRMCSQSCTKCRWPSRQKRHESNAETSTASLERASCESAARIFRPRMRLLPARRRERRARLQGRRPASTTSHVVSQHVARTVGEIDRYHRGFGFLPGQWPRDSAMLAPLDGTKWVSRP
jgi:hypothetical protein